MVAASLLALLIPAAALANSPTESPPTDSIGGQLMWVAVTGSADFPDRTYSLEIGESAWAVTPDSGGGVVSLESNHPLTVRLVDVEACRTVTRFTAEVASKHVITVAADGTATSEDVSDGPIDTGPALTPTEPVGCLPDSSTSSQGGTGLGLVTAGLALVALGGLGLVTARRWSVTGQR
jgi:hypothetical protein